MRTLPAIIAVAAAILSVVCAAFLSPSGTSASVEHQRERPLLADRIDVADVVRIELTRPDTGSLAFERSGAEQVWNQVVPFAHPMQAFSIRQLAVLAASVRYVGTIDPSADDALDAAALGFEPPRGSLELEHSDGRSLSIELGRRGIAGRAYIRVNDDPTIYVIDQSLHTRALGMNPLEWRERSIFRDVSIDASSISRVEGRGDVRLERTGRQWNLTQPVSTRADDVNFEDYISSIARAQHSGFIADQPADLSRFGLAAPAASMTIANTRKVVDLSGTLVDETVEQTLLIGSRVGGTTQDRFGMVAGTPVVVRLPVAVLQSLFRDPRLLADTSASGLEPADVKTIRISGPNGDFRLQRDLEKWIALDHNNAEVSATRVEELLQQLTLLRAPSLGFDSYPLDEHVANVIMTTFTGRHDTVRVAFSPSAGQWKLDNGDNVLRVHPAALKLSLSPADFGLTSAID